MIKSIAILALLSMLLVVDIGSARTVQPEWSIVNPPAGYCSVTIVIHREVGTAFYEMYFLWDTRGVVSMPANGQDYVEVYNCDMTTRTEFCPGPD
jgi:hypothetical protein